MLRVLVGCTSEERAASDLGKTRLWRDDVQRQVVTSLGAARAALHDQPSLAILERDLPWTPTFAREVRDDPATRHVSIAVYAEGEMDPIETDLLGGGVNAVLRLPAEGWDRRLAFLLEVAPRQAVRVPVFVEVDAGTPVRTTLGTSVNVSEHGILIQSQVLEVGAELTFALRLPGAAEPVRGRGRVVRMGPEDTFGLEFTDVSAECLRTIRDFVAREQS